MTFQEISRVKELASFRGDSFNEVAFVLEGAGLLVQIDGAQRSDSRPSSLGSRVEKTDG